MAEREQRQRHLMERWGMAAAFALALIFLGAGVALIVSGRDVSGTIIVVIVVGALAGVFFKGRSDFSD